MSSLCEQLKQRRLESSLLFPKGYSLLEGLSPQRHKLAYKFADDHQELVARLERKFPTHPRDINWEKADKYAGSTLVRNCHDIVQSLQSAYAFYEDLALFRMRSLELLDQIHQSLGPLSYKDGPNELVYDWMELFCDLLCLQLLTQKTQKERIIQIYAAAYYAQKREDPPHHAEVCAFMTSIAVKPVQQFQQDMLHFHNRIKQVTTLIASLPLTEASGILSLSNPAQSPVDTLEISENLVLKYLMDYRDLERWMLFGVLACPGICGAAALRGCLTHLLSKSHHLQIYRDLYEPVHVLFRDSIYTKLVELYTAEKGRILRNSYVSQDLDIELPNAAQLISSCNSWKDSRSDVLTSRDSIKPQTKRSFSWKGVKSEKARSFRGLGGIVSSSFSFSERSIEEGSDSQGEPQRQLEKLQSCPDDVKAKKLRAKMEIREIISTAEEEASATAHRRHAAGCFALSNLLKGILSAAEVRPDVVVYGLDRIVTALSLAQNEILWEVVHCAQSVIPQKKRETFHFKEKPNDSARSRKSEEVDGALAVGPLIELMVQVQSLLLRYRSSICRHRIEQLKGRYAAASEALISVLHRSEDETGVGPRLVGQLQEMEMWIEALTFPALLSQSDEMDPLRRVPKETFWIWDRLSDFKDAWKYIESTFADVDSSINIGTLLNMGCDDVLLDFKQVVLDVMQVGNFVEALSSRCSLKELAFYENQILRLIRFNFREASTPESSFNVLCFLHVFAQFHRNDIWGDDPFNRANENEFIETAEKCGMLLVVQLEDFIRELFMKCTLPCVPGHHPSKVAQMVDLLSYWFSVIGSFGQVEVIPNFVFNSADFLNNAIVNVLRDILLEHSLRDGRQGFQQMKATYNQFLSLLAELQSYVEFDILTAVHGAILGLIKQDENGDTGSHHPFLDSIATESDASPYFRDSAAFNEQCLVTLLADAMATDIIRDPRNIGIIFDPRQRRFIKKEAETRPHAWVGVGCSVQDLRSLLSIFGVLGVQQLELQFRSLIYESVGKLDAYLKEHVEMLKNVTRAFESEKELIDSAALNHLSKELSNLPAVIDITLQFSRCLLVRQLLSDAYALQIQTTVDAATPTHRDLGLPTASQPDQEFPSSPEPVVVEVFRELHESGELDRWRYLPALFSCLVHEMLPNVKQFDPEKAAFSNGMHQIVYTLDSIALALETVTPTPREDVASDGRPSRQSFNLLFAKCLAMFTFHSSETQNTISDTCLLLSSVCGEVLPLEQLESIGLAPTRVKSAHAASYKRPFS